MSIAPQSEMMKKAVKWVAQARERHPHKKIAELVEEACLTFDLPPKDAEFLMRLTRGQD